MFSIIMFVDNVLNMVYTLVDIVFESIQPPIQIIVKCFNESLNSRSMGRGLNRLDVSFFNDVLSFLFVQISSKICHRYIIASVFPLI